MGRSYRNRSKRRNTRRTQRKNYSKRRRKVFRPYNTGRRAASISTFRTGSIVSDRFFTKLRYTDVRKLNTASTPYNDYVYRGNSLYDPDFTGAGAQPQGFDQWSAFYGQYRVFASKISVTFITNGTTQAQTIAIIPNLTSTGFADQVIAIESPYSRSSCIAANAGMGKQTLGNFMSVAKIWGVDKQTVQSDDLFRANTSGSNPSNQFYWHVFCYDMGGTEANCFIQTKIVYYCEFFDRNQLSTS